MEELGRWTRDAPPTHFILKIKSFSTLSDSSMQRYESPEFEAADTKWKLAIYPNGNKTRGGQDHISVYLVLADKGCLSLMKEMVVTFRLFVFDHIKDKYFTDEKTSRFHAVKYEYGFDKFLPLGVFNDATNGYLVNDTCMFGAEVFLVQHTNELKCLSMLSLKSVPFIFTWKIEKFSNLEDKEYRSDKFRVSGYDWRLDLFPKGNNVGNGNSLSLYLTLCDAETSILPAERQVIVERKLRVVDQLDKNHIQVGATSCFSSCLSWGHPRFLSLTELMNKSNGYLVNDSIIVEAEVIVLGSTSNCV